MSPTKKFFSGNTIEQAVLQAARFFQIDPELVAYEQVERRHGFLKVRRRVVIGVNSENPRREPSLAVAEPAGPDREPGKEPGKEPEVSARPDARSVARGRNEATDASRLPEAEARQEPAATEARREPAAAAPSSREEGEDAWKNLSPADATEAAEEALRRVFRLGDLDLSAQVTTSEAGLEIELSGTDEDHLFEDRGRLLLAFQHLLPRMVRGLTGASVLCRVDSDNFQEVRVERLRMLAQDAAAEVRRERRVQTLEPMSPDERRIVHLALADDPAVETESHGTGLFKRVAVRPVRPSGAGDRYSR